MNDKHIIQLYHLKFADFLPIFIIYYFAFRAIPVK